MSSAGELPHKTVAVLERRERMGGTWDLFRYPGVRSDSDMYTFGYKFRPWMDVKVLADGPSIQQYIADTAAEFGIDEKIHYGLKVLTAEWSSPESRWTVTARTRRPAKRSPTPAITSSAAPATTTMTPATCRPSPGWTGSRVACIHPQFWPEDLDYAGKKVVVIGSGATAVTLIPAMAADVEHITMLQRSPSYIFNLPALDKISEFLGRFLPDNWVYGLARKRNIAVQRRLYQACRRWPDQMRRLLLWLVDNRSGRPST